MNGTTVSVPLCCIGHAFNMHTIKHPTLFPHGFVVVMEKKREEKEGEGDPFLWVLTPMATAPMATVPRKASPTWCTPCGTSWVIEECEEDGKLIRKMELDSTKAAHLVGRLEDVCGPIEPSPNHSAH